MPDGLFVVLTCFRIVNIWNVLVPMLWLMVPIHWCCIFLLVYLECGSRMRLVSVWSCFFVLSIRPVFFLLASHFTLSSLLISKCLFSVMLVISFLTSSNAVLCWIFQSSLFCALVLLCDNSGLSGSDSSANIVVKVIRWCMHPMNDLSCLSVFGVSNFFYRFAFFLGGVIKVGIIWHPNKINYFFANSHYGSFSAKISLSNR